MEAWLLHQAVYIIPGIILAYYFGLPLLIFFTHRCNEDFDIVPWNPLETRPPKAIFEFFHQNDQKLLALGFRSLGDYMLPNAMPNVQAVVRMYIHEANRDSAMISAIFGTMPDQKIMQVRYVEFVTRFANDNPKAVQTNNSPMPGCYAPVPGKLTFRFPHVRDTIALYRLHQAILKRHAPAGQKTLTVLEQYLGDAVAYLADTVLRGSYREQESLGILRYSPTERCWRATFKGAYSMTWKQLWPIKQIRWAGIRREAYRLERELATVF
jgi:hypothetical protein